MPSNRSILADISERGLKPSTPHVYMGKDGRLHASVKLAASIDVITVDLSVDKNIVEKLDIVPDNIVQTHVEQQTLVSNVVQTTVLDETDEQKTDVAVLPVEDVHVETLEVGATALDTMSQAQDDVERRYQEQSDEDRVSYKSSIENYATEKKSKKFKAMKKADVPTKE